MYFLYLFVLIKHKKIIFFQQNLDENNNDIDESDTKEVTFGRIQNWINDRVYELKFFQIELYNFIHYHILRAYDHETKTFKYQISLLNKDFLKKFKQFLTFGEYNMKSFDFESHTMNDWGDSYKLYKNRTGFEKTKLGGSSKELAHECSAQVMEMIFTWLKYQVPYYLKKHLKIFNSKLKPADLIFLLVEKDDKKIKKKFTLSEQDTKLLDLYKNSHSYKTKEDEMNNRFLILAIILDIHKSGREEQSIFFIFLYFCINILFFIILSKRRKKRCKYFRY